MPKLIDTFAGDDAALVECIEALIELNDAGKLVPNGIGGHARKMLAAAAVRLTAGATDPVANFRQRLRQGAEAPAEVQQGVAGEKIEAIIKEQMREWWDDICSDTGCHPLDFERRGKTLWYDARHWTEAVAKYSAQAIAALATPQQGQEVEGWRPIESAPKDGTDIILGSGPQEYQGNPVEPRVTIGHWMTDEECQERIGDCGGECRCPEYKYHDPYWITWDGGFTEENPPEFWMPLPSTPTAAGESE